MKALDGDLVPALLWQWHLRTGVKLAEPWPDNRDWAPMFRSPWTYFVRMCGFVKVGTTTNPKERLAYLGHGIEGEKFRKHLGVVGETRCVLLLSNCCTKREHVLHRLLRRESLGYEWFRGPDTELMIAELSAAADAFSLAAA